MICFFEVFFGSRASERLATGCVCDTTSTTSTTTNQKYATRGQSMIQSFQKCSKMLQKYAKTCFSIKWSLIEDLDIYLPSL